MKCPYGCIRKEFSFYDCISEPGREPEDGDVGMCSYCGGWWELKDGGAIPYIPTQDQLELVIPAVSAARAKAAIHARSLGQRLL